MCQSDTQTMLFISDADSLFVNTVASLALSKQKGPFRKWGFSDSRRQISSMNHVMMPGF